MNTTLKRVLLICGTCVMCFLPATSFVYANTLDALCTKLNQEMKAVQTNSTTAALDEKTSSKDSTHLNPKPNFSFVALTLVQEKHFLEGEPTCVFDQVYVDETGHTYKLIFQDEPKIDLLCAKPSQKYIRQIAKEIPKKDIGCLNKYFPLSVNISDGYFSGEINISKNPYKIKEVYESFTAQVDKEFDIENLPDNDVSRLPKSKDFEVSSDEFLGARKMSRLDLLSVSYEVTSTNELGLASTYTAHMCFRGEQSWLDVSHYIVEATYEGEIFSSKDIYSTRATYMLIKDTSALKKSGTFVPKAVLALVKTQDKATVWPTIVGAVSVLILAFVLFLVWALLLRKNAALVVSLAGKQKVLIKRHLSPSADKATFVVPDKIELADGAHYAIKLKAALASKDAELLVLWRGVSVAKKSFRPLIELNIQEAKDIHTLSAIAECVLDASDKDISDI